MISSEVQRTLVKSPPELWAEISDPASLARHLGEFGEIRITRVEPEQRIEWEAGDTSGSVVIKPSGWGTKVKLTVNRERAQLDETADDELPVEAAAESELQEPAIVQPTETAQPPITAIGDTEPDLAAEPQEQAEPEPQDEAAPARPEQAQPEPQEQAEPQPQDEAAPEPLGDPRAELPAPEPRRGFFARLFGRRRAATVSDPAGKADGDGEDDAPDSTVHAQEHEPYNALAVWAAQIEPDGRDDAASEPPQDAAIERRSVPALALPGEAPRPPASGGDLEESGEDGSRDGEPAEEISAEITAAEKVAAEQVTAVLTGVLDRLGAAHHRPFSRS
jgi:hypothetical protein